ncbi:MAG: VWA domain-containing protein [Gammaproteobacteria bacterium]|nr:VWA domain-containing protein [Gammaproteobacteria bacterium]
MNLAQLNSLHWQQPWWLLAIPILWIIICLWWFNHLPKSLWREWVSPELQKHVLKGNSSNNQRWPLYMLLFASFVISAALAGPAWVKLPQPVYQNRAALVVVLDLSRSMLAQDVKPSRLIRAKMKLTDLLRQRREGQTALLVYAAQSYAVTPLTTDTATILAHLETLDPSIMPAQGSRPDLALQQAINLLHNSGIQQGQVLLITDGIEHDIDDSIAAVRAAGHRMSILGIGTEDGAPIPDIGGGFLRERNGGIIVARLNSDNLKSLARAGDGSYHALTLDDSDLNHVLSDARLPDEKNSTKIDRQVDRWRDEGPWLLWLVLPLALFAFRRGALTLCLLACLLLPTPDSYAAEMSDWKNIFRNQDQRALNAYQAQQYQDAAKTFNDKNWQGSAYYRAGDYQQAQQAWSQHDTADSWYNQGNAWVKLGELEKARSAYKKALQHDPKHTDAKYNFALLDQEQNKSDSPSSDSSDQSQESDDQNQSGDKGESSQDQSDSSSNKSQNQSNNQSPDQSKDKTDQQKSDSSDQQNKNSKDANEKAKQDAANAQDMPRANEPPKPEKDNSAAEQSPAQQQETNKKPNAMGSNDESNSEQEKNMEQWLQRVPDDPGGLLRRKFLYQYKQRDEDTTEAQQW